MPSERDWALVCWALDGELPPEARLEFRALMASANGRRLHATGLAQSERLKRLARVAAPPGMFDSVLTAIESRPVFGVPVVIAHAPVGTRRSRRWLPALLALAAMMMLAIGLSVSSRSDPNPVAVAPPPPSRVNPPPEVAAKPRVANPLPSVAPPPRLVPDVVAVTPPPIHALRPPAVEGGVSFSTGPRFVTLAPRTPFLIPVEELASPSVAGQLRSLCVDGGVVRGDLFTTDPVAALKSLRDALKTAGVSSFGNPVALDTPANSQSGWAFYSERLSADDCTKLFAALAKAGQGTRMQDARLHLYAATAADARDFREWTGVDRGFWKRPRTSNPASPTADQVAGALRSRHKAALLIPLTTGPRPTAVLGAEAKAFWQQADILPGGAILIVCRGL